MTTAKSNKFLVVYWNIKFADILLFEGKQIVSVFAQHSCQTSFDMIRNKINLLLTLVCYCVQF